MGVDYSTSAGLAGAFAAHAGCQTDALASQFQTHALTARQQRSAQDDGSSDLPGAGAQQMPPWLTVTGPSPADTPAMAGSGVPPAVPPYNTRSDAESLPTAVQKYAQATLPPTGPAGAGGHDAGSEGSAVSGVPHDATKVGYGDTPGGVPIGELRNLSPGHVRERVNSHLDAYQRGNGGSLDDALDLSVAYRAQGGGNSGFQAIHDRFGQASHEGLEATVAQRRADTLNTVSPYIRTLNGNNDNYGAQIYDALRTIDNASDPDAAAFAAFRINGARSRTDMSGLGMSENAVFNGVMDAAGHGRQRLGASIANEQLTLGDMAAQARENANKPWSQIVSEAAGKFLDSGGPVYGGAATIGGIRGPAGGRPGPRPAGAPEVVPRPAGVIDSKAPRSSLPPVHGPGTLPPAEPPARQHNDDAAEQSRDAAVAKADSARPREGSSEAGKPDAAERTADAASVTASPHGGVSDAPRYLEAAARFLNKPTTDVQDFYDQLEKQGVNYRDLISNAMNKHGLTADEAHAVFGYTTKLFYRDLNNSLTTGGTPEANGFSDLIESGLAKMPPSTQLQYRGWRLDSPEGAARFDERFKLGSTVTSNFWSTAPDQADAYPAARNLVIKTDQARDVSDLAFGVHFHPQVGKPPYSQETVIPPGVRFTVTGVDARGRIELEQQK